MNKENMDLIDSYVKEVGQYLPQETRAEITEDLYEAVLEEVFELADAADRSPSLADQQTVLSRFGHPFKVAGRYLPQRYLIGPELYPQLLRTLKIVLSIAVAGLVIFALTFAQVDGWTLGPWQLISMSLKLLLWVSVAVFGVFVALEYSGERLNWYESWAPTAANVNAVGVIKRGDVVTNLVTEGFFLLWWNDVLVLLEVLPIVDLSVQLSPVWQDYFWHLNILIGAAFVLHIYVLIKGVWQRVTQMTEVVINVALLGVGTVLLFADVLVVLGVEDGLSTAASGVNENLQRVVRTIVLVIIGFTIWDIWLGLRVLWGNPAATLATHQVREY